MTLWAVTSYFNPKQFKSRYYNFQTFRGCLDLPLLTVEWALDGDFQLTSRDSDVLIPVPGGDLMWQKERLLNIAVSHLPPDCDRVAWLDCDIVFERADWIEELERSLDRARVVQLFSEVVHLAPVAPAVESLDAVLARSGAHAPLLVRESLLASQRRASAETLARRIRSGALDRGSANAALSGAKESDERSRLSRRPSSGHAWAATREVLERHRLYDGCVCGVGDMAIALAALGRQAEFTDSYPLNRYQTRHYRKWADGFASAVDGRVDLVPTRIHHLFHGDLANRQYWTRLQMISESDFDPARDLALDENGLWTWRKDQERLEPLMHRYFEKRSEDGSARYGGMAAPGA